MMKLCICAATLMLSMSLGYGQDGMGGGMGGSDPAPAAKQEVAVTGTVKLDGKAPKPKKIKEIGGDAYCSTQHTDAVYSEEVVVGEGNTLANVFIYVKKNAPKCEVPKKAAEINQKGCIYEPHIVPLMAGQTLTIKTSDDTAHNINVQAKLNKGFNESQASKGMTSDKVFALPELSIAVGCQVHPWMKAVLHVVDNTFFAVTGKDGKFSIAGLPAGEYELEAVHEKFGKMNGTVKVTDKGATWDFAFKGE